MQNSTTVQTNGGNNQVAVIINPPPSIEAFIAAVHNGVHAWEQAGQMLVAMLERDKHVFKKIVEAYPFITIDTLEVFHSIGVHALYPLTMMLPRTVLPMVRRMRYDAQKQITENPVEVVSRMAGDKPVVIRKPVAKLTADEARRALWPKGNRSVAWQVRSLTEKTVTALEPKPEPKTAKEMERKPISKGNYVIRRGPGGAFIFEKTMANPYNTQRVMLESGQAVIELCEWGGRKLE